MFDKKIIIIIAAALVVGFALGSVFGGFIDITGNGESAEEEPADLISEPEGENGFEEAKPQLEQQLIQQKEQEMIMEHLDELREEATVETNLDIIDEGDESAVIATVNGEEILKEELLAMEEQEKEQMAMMGMDPEDAETEQMMEEMRPEILENLVLMTLLEQQAEKEGITAEEKDVEEYYQQFVQQAGGEEAMEQQLAQADITEDELKEDIADQLPTELYLEKYIDEHFDEEDLDITEEELRELYEAQKQQMEQQMDTQEMEEMEVEE
ncbi:MAG: SurA N-terminal domain-containing protein [Bacillota bacterium]